jgi:hypothetical protein
MQYMIGGLVCLSRERISQHGQILAPEKVKSGQVSLRSAKIVHSEQIATLDPLSGLVAQRLLRSLLKNQVVSAKMDQLPT